LLILLESEFGMVSATRLAIDKLYKTVVKIQNEVKR